MIIWNSTKMTQRTLNYTNGRSCAARVLVTTWWVLFIPVFKKEKLMTTNA